MNPYSRFKKWIIGDALASTEDVFQKVRIDVLFSFTLFFFITNIPYAFITVSLTALHFSLAVFSLVGLLFVLVILRMTNNVKYATLFYVTVHWLLILSHFIMNNGRIEAQGILFFTLIVLFSFLMLGRAWGLVFTAMVVLLVIAGNYNMNSGCALFSIPPKYRDPEPAQSMAYLMLIPLLINIYLISRFVIANQKAEAQINEQKTVVEAANRLLELKNEDIVSSINYAKRIQQAVLPNEESIYRSLPPCFIFYQPRDIVSGDFFWFHENSDSAECYIVAADCTGHGVPGAFMTVIGSNALTQAVIENKATSPSEILRRVDDHVTYTLKQEKDHYGLVQDGMDLALLKINKAKKQLIFTSAKRPAFFIRNGALRDIKGSKSSIGGLRSEEKQFEEIVIDYRENDTIYLFTDGYVDQFGGANNKKFTSRRLRELVLEIQSLPIAEQKIRLAAAFESWKGSNEQTDDVVVIGIRF